MMNGSDSLSRTNSMYNDIEKEELEKMFSEKRYKNGSERGSDYYTITKDES